MFSFFGLFNSQSLTAQTCLMYLLQSTDQVGRCNEFGRQRRETTATLVDAIVSSGIVVFVSYGDLLQAEMLLGTLTTGLLIISFVLLRINQPKAPRPFVACSSHLLLAICLVTPVVFMAFINALSVIWSGISIVDVSDPLTASNADAFAVPGIGVSSAVSVPAFIVAMGFLTDAVMHKRATKVRVVE
eukprot:gnl/MRDRNA2_/MRDRNA2_58850_c0_seq1.p1 gnl/MRDRNA2_/MRDRNA2_58850_c0~~gnl/MRDRNA2_/MRDRNA2_58850_c0_seq1.p1  ORF type:complete len:187 (+),score=26.14 gnl/MRDRNA2_/MRDRNA2_58850_c0_seq1:2-562(+)